MTEDPAVRLLRETLAAHQDDAPEPGDLANAARSRAAEAGRTWWSGAAAAAAVVLVATGVGAALVRNGNAGATVEPASSSVAAVTGSPAVSTPGSASPLPAVVPPKLPLWVPNRPPPDGWKLVSSLGVELAVPKDWPVVGAIAGCDPLPAAFVERGGGAVAGCAYTEPATFTLVRIERLSTVRALGATGAPSTGAPTTGAPATGGASTSQGSEPTPSPHPLNRLPASFTERRLADGRTELALSFVDRDTGVVLRGPDKGLLYKIFGTIQAADVDSAGCPAVSGPRPDWDRADRGPVPKVDIGNADKVTVCAYSAGPGEADPRLAASVELTGALSVLVLEALGSASAGPNPDADPADCSPSTPELSRLVLLLHRPGDSVDQVQVHHDGCRNRYVADADGQSRVSLALLQAAYGALGMGFGTNVTG